MTENSLAHLDTQAFSALTEPHRHELRVHCYRMLGALDDAEDVVQETFLRAWRRRETYAGRASVRAWLYGIATNACLDELAKRSRRFVPRTRQVVGDVDQPIPADVNEPIWLEPYPDDWLGQGDTHPEGAVIQREQISLAFITALHRLPPRQRAVLLLREVLEWSAQDVAEWTGMTVSAVKSALHRARTTLAEQGALTDAPQDWDDGRLAAYVQAWEQADIPALLRLLKDDATFSMPPIPAWYQGRETIGKLVGKTIFRGEAQGRWRLLPTRANGQVAFGLYRLEGGEHRAYGIQVLTLTASGIADIITFRRPGLVTRFGLPEGVG